MTVRTETVTVYFGGRRRWFSLAAACNAEASAILNRFCDCSTGNGHDVALEICTMHSDHAKYVRVRAKLIERIRRQFLARPVEIPAPEQRAIAACKVYVAATGEVLRLTNQFREALECCPGDGTFSDEGSPRTHMSTLYRGLRGLEDRLAFKACPHCVLADQLIQQRKSARQSLGAAKRQIAKVGRAP